MNPTLFSRLIATAVLAASSLAYAADTTPAASPAADKLSAARAEIQAGRWVAAIDELKKVNDTGSADWNNLMGYALRKNKTPDLAESERHYDVALRIDPHHRNALEYSGELYLRKGALDKAEARLASLAAECPSGCEQYAELSSAIERYKSGDNKFVATTW